MDLMHAAHVPAGDGPFPTIIALHGWGASAHDLLGLAPLILGGQALVICPQGPVMFGIEMEGGGAMPGYGWFPMSGGAELDPEAFATAGVVLRGFIEAACQLYPVDPRKTVLMGFSQGGVMAYDLALRDPGRYAGLVALSSWLPESLAKEIPKLPEHENFPIFVSHGTEDPMIPVERARESRDALLPFGVSLTLREYEMGHEIRPEALKDLLEWLESKVVSPITLV
jgi:phospholipase/carboxylesterase